MQVLNILREYSNVQSGCGDKTKYDRLLRIEDAAFQLFTAASPSSDAGAPARSS